MNDYVSVMLPLVRPLLVKLGVFFGLLACALLALWGLERWQEPTWKQQQSGVQVAQSQLSQANTDLADIERLAAGFQRSQQSGLVGGSPRAGWIEDLQRLAAEARLDPLMTYTLAAPVAVASAGGGAAKVARHELAVQFKGVHDIEALQLVGRFLALYPHTARLHGCDMGGATDQGMNVGCRIHLLHIDTAAASAGVPGAPATGSAGLPPAAFNRPPMPGGRP